MNRNHGNAAGQQKVRSVRVESSAAVVDMFGAIPRRPAPEQRPPAWDHGALGSGPGVSQWTSLIQCDGRAENTRRVTIRYDTADMYAMFYDARNILGWIVKYWVLVPALSLPNLFVNRVR